MKFILVPCAIFLTMAMAPNDSTTSSIDPMVNGQVKAVRKKARACYGESFSPAGDHACAINQNNELNVVLDTYVSELARRLSPVDASQLFAEQRAWNLRREHISRRGLKTLGVDSNRELNQRYSETLRRFGWLSKVLAAVNETNASKPSPEAVPLAAAKDPTPAASEVSPAPALATVPASNGVATLAKPAPGDQPPRVRNILAEARQNSWVPSDQIDTTSSTDDPRFRRDLRAAQISFSGCMSDAGRWANANNVRMQCEATMRKDVTRVFETFFREQLSKVSESKRAPLQEEQRQWVNKRASTCDVVARSFVPAQFDRDAAKCWLGMTRERFVWAAKLVKP